MNLADNIRELRLKKGILQKQVATEIGMGISHYNKIENGQREASVKILEKLAQFYEITIDEIVHFKGELPKEVTIEDKTLKEQLKLLGELEEKDRSIIFALIDTMLTKKKFKDFFQQNVAPL
ncbi:MAG: helix-turn-helix transcriptional regulator [Bacteroidota bacterium]